MPHASGIWYEESGDPQGMPLVLLAGFGAQLIWWRDELCAALADFRVIRVDNRDVGRSRRFGGPADLDAGYGVADMADDVVRVLDAAGVDRAHVAGHSMGGIIAQMLVLAHPGRVASMTLLSTIPEIDPKYVLHDDGTALMSVVQPRYSRDEFVERWVVWAGDGHVGASPFDEDWVRTMAALHYDRGYCPDGQPRQWAALLRAPKRLARLSTVSVPTLVVHGRLDADLHWRAAVDMAAAIEGAELQVYGEMGHELPRALWPDLVAGITRTAHRAVSAGTR